MSDDPSQTQPPPSTSTDPSIETTEEAIPEPLKPKDVLYCGVCSFPPEYCEFGSSLSRCKEWLKEEHSDLYDNYYSEEALQAKIGTLSLDKQAKLDEEAAKKEKKAVAKAGAAEKKKKESQVTIKRVERTKRKHVTAVHGLEAFGIDLKKAAKLFAQKFATGSSVTKNAQGFDEIVVQGDVSDEILDMLIEEVGVLKGVPEDNVVLVEDKKKKGGDGA